MKASFILLLALAPGFVIAGPRNGANYSIAAEIADVGGRRMTSANYTNDGSCGLIAGLSTLASPSTVAKQGYPGQLYEVVGFVIDSNPSSLAEGGSLQLHAARLLDDATRLALSATSVAWSVESGPLRLIDANGLATAGTVYQDTNASALGNFESFSSSLLLTVLNVNADDLPGYAGDAIDDDWQVQYFGLPPNPNAAPNVDADGSGHRNLFKFVAGLNPLDGSRFGLTIEQVPGQASQKNLIFTPLVGGRTYLVQFASSLVAPVWDPLPQSTQSDNGNVRTVTDLNALPSPKFYRVQISRP